MAERRQDFHVIAHDLDDRQERRGKQCSRNAPQPVPEDERRNHHNRIESEPTREQDRRDHLTFE